MTESVRVVRPVASQAPDEVFAFVLDAENYSRLMPNVNRVRIVEQQEGYRITHWNTEIEQAPLIWTERDTILPARHRIEFESIEGDFDVFRGCWEVLRGNGDGRLHVACELEYSVGIPVIEEIVGPVLKQKIIENLGIMLHGLAEGMDAEP
jgi:ribosome-associated toxin RatA of RatAB toxin-antitoxin module